MRRFEPRLVPNPDFKHLWVDPDAPIELNEQGQIIFPTESQPFLLKTVEVQDEP